MLTLLRLLLAAGNETTTNLIGNGMLALLRNPDQLQALRDDPGLIPSAVEELLRFDSPVQTNFRGAAEDCDVNGFPVKQGQTVVLLLGAANRDPAEFDQPDRLDVTRHPRSHVAFGRGIHHCLGAPLALLEGRIVIEMLLERFASMRLLTDRPSSATAWCCAASNPSRSLPRRPDARPIVSCACWAIPSSMRKPWTPNSDQPHSHGSLSRPPATGR